MPCWCLILDQSSERDFPLVAQLDIRFVSRWTCDSPHQCWIRLNQENMYVTYTDCCSLQPHVLNLNEGLVNSSNAEPCNLHSPHAATISCVSSCGSVEHTSGNGDGLCPVVAVQVDDWRQPRRLRITHRPPVAVTQVVFSPGIFKDGPWVIWR